MTFRCPDCKSSNYGRHSRFRVVAPVGPLNIRWHECKDCHTTFVTAERVLKANELEAYAEMLQEQIRG